MLPVIINDATLRDGEQSAGVAFGLRDKVEIARRLDAIGVGEIEAGCPAMGGDEREAVRIIASMGLKAEVSAWCRAVPEDIEAAALCGVKRVFVSLPVSDLHIGRKLGKSRGWVIERIGQAVALARSLGIAAAAGAEDASRAAPGFLRRFAETARDAGAERLRYCDTVGLLDPFGTYAAVRRLRGETGLAIEIHAHDDLGMATANALAGIRAGAGYVTTTVNGLGERAGNAALEEVAMALRHVLGVDPGVGTEGLLGLSRLVAEASGRPIPEGKSVVGANAFRHESGIHADGVLKDPATYEPFPPGEVGAAREIVLGKHSGSRAVRAKFGQLGVHLTDSQAREVLSRIRVMAAHAGRSLAEGELLAACRVS